MDSPSLELLVLLQVAGAFLNMWQYLPPAAAEIERDWWTIQTWIDGINPTLGVYQPFFNLFFVSHTISYFFLGGGRQMLHQLNCNWLSVSFLCWPKNAPR